MKKIIFIVLILMFSTLNAGILKWEQDCQGVGNDESLVCYHSVAMSYAIVGQKEKAVENCQQVAAIDPDSAIAKNQANRCFSDVAVVFAKKQGEEIDFSLCEVEDDYEGYVLCLDDIAQLNADYSICNNIEGNDNQYEICKELVIAEMKKNSVWCSVLFILPIIFFASLRFR